MGVANQSSQHQNSLVSITDAAKKLQTPIFKLNLDCFGRLMEYLLLENLAALAQTCKLLQTVVAHYFPIIYPFANVHIDYDGLCISNGELSDLDGFSAMVQRVTFYYDSNSITDTRCKQLKSLKYVSFMGITFNAAKIEAIERILQNLDGVELCDCLFEVDIFEQFLELCKNLKQFKILRDFHMSFSTKWLLQTFPQLECLTLAPVECNREINKLKTFFHQNSTIRTFATNSDFIWINRATMMHVKFNELFINLSIDQSNLNAFCMLLNEMHAVGTFKRVFITTSQLNQKIVDGLISVKALAGLNLINIESTANGIDLSSFINLKWLHIFFGIEQITNLPHLAQKLTNLKEISFHQVDFDEILDFVYHSAELKTIACDCIENISKRIDLHAMNQEREKLHKITAFVSQVTIYIPESDYIEFRMKSKTNMLSLIEIRRYEQYDNTKFLI